MYVHGHWSLFKNKSHIFIPLRVEVDFQDNQARQSKYDVVNKDHSDLQMCNTVVDKLHVFKILNTSPTENVIIVLIEMIADKDDDGVEDDHHDVHPTLAMSSPLQG